jgi:O-glycosyl hydrolase
MISHLTISLRRSCAIERLEERICLAATVTINQNQTQQTIQALGGDFAKGKYGSATEPPNDSIGQYNLANLHPKEARIGIPLDTWAPTADVTDPTKINMADFSTTDTGTTNVLKLMQSLKTSGAGIEASIWDVPNWLVSNPQLTNSRIIPESMYPYVINALAAFLVQADTVYGVKVDYLSINEPDGGNRLAMTAQQEADFIAEAGPAFAQLGLSYTPLFLVGETYTPAHVISYDTTILADTAAAPYEGPIDYHAWGGIGYSQSTYNAIIALAQQYNKTIWCSELGDDPNSWQDSPSPFPTWGYAIDTAESYYVTMKEAQVSVDLYWEMENDFPLLSTNPTVLYPSYYVVQTLMQNFTPGVQMITANSSTTPVESMAAKDPTTGRLAIELINTGSSTTQTVTVTGLPVGIVMTQIRSDATDNAVNEGLLVANSSGSFTFSLPAQTVVTLSGTPGIAVTAMQHVYNVLPNQLTFTFNTNVGTSAFNLSSLSIATDSGEPPTAPIAYSYNSTNNTAIWTLPANVVNGTYTATLTGSLLPQAANLNFFSLVGDVNHDGIVNATDFSILAANYGQTTGSSWSTGDFNFDGTVNLLDFNALAINYGVNLFAISSATPDAVAAADAPVADQMLPQSLAANSTPVNNTPSNDLFSSQSINRLDVLGADTPLI